MLIYGIGIYSSEDLKKLKFVQHMPSFFNSNQLDTLEKKTLTRVHTEGLMGPYEAIVKNEYHYIKRSEQLQIMMAICCRQKMDYKEIYYLFKNIEHIYLNRLNARYSLDDVINNPLGYVNRDLFIKGVHDEVSEVKDHLIQVTLPLLLERGEKLEEITAKTLQLEYDSRQFNMESKKLNSCCGIW